MANTIKIRNKATGELKDIPVTEAQNYGLSPVEALSRVQAQTSLEDITAGKDPTVEAQKRKDSAAQTVKDDKAKETIKGMITTMDKLKQQAADASVMDLPGAVLGSNAKLKNFESTKILLARHLAKLVEAGRISDQDAKAYTNQVLGVNAIGFQGATEDALNNVQDNVITLAGFNPKDFKKPDQAKKQQDQNPLMAILGKIGGGINDSKKDPGGFIQGFQSPDPNGDYGKFLNKNYPETMPTSQVQKSPAFGAGQAISNPLSAIVEAQMTANAGGLQTGPIERNVQGAVSKVANPIQDLIANVLQKGGQTVEGKTSVLADVLKNPTKNKAANAATKAADAATEAGKSVHWNDISQEIKDEVFKDLGKTSDVKQAIAKSLGSETPAGVEGIPSSMQKTPTDLIDWRRQISKRGGGSFLQKAMRGSDIQDKVDATVRRVVSKNLHELAPNTKSPDAAFALYSKLHGDAPSWAKKIVLAYASGKIAKSVLGVNAGGAVAQLASKAL